MASLAATARHRKSYTWSSFDVIEHHLAVN
jgi:hypothetical protein